MDNIDKYGNNDNIDKSGNNENPVSMITLINTVTMTIR